MFGLTPLITLYSFGPTLNSNSTSQLPALIVLTIWSFLIIRNGLLNKAKHNASNNVDLPLPFAPITNVNCDFLKSTSIGTLPVDKKFL